MTDTRVDPQVLYEIAMSIGNSLDLSKMLEESLSAYVRKLQGSAGIVVEMKTETVGRITFVPIFSVPSDATIMAPAQAGLTHIPEHLLKSELPDFLSKMPILYEGDQDRFIHIMELAGFGLLLITRSGKPLASPVIESIKPLNTKLAGACIACRQNERTARINEQLLEQINDRARVQVDPRQAEQCICQAGEKYRSIFENAIMGIFQMTPGGNLINANKAFARILGYENPDELLSSAMVLSRRFLTDDECYSRFMVTMERFGVINEFEFQFLRQNGTSAWISIDARAVRDEGGRIDYLEGIAQDITGRKLLESRLLQSQKMEAIGTLAGGIAHDFNNILGAIVGFVEMTRIALHDTKLRGYLEQVLQACDRAKNLVRQILAFSRADRQEKQPVDIGLVINEVVKLLRATLPSTLEIRTSIGPDLEAVLADHTQIHQILINLCTNAAHAMQDKGGLIEIEIDNFEVLPDMKPLRVDLNPGPYVKVSITDTGSGIDPAILDRIFDPFFTTKNEEEGTGLGLSVVYGIVKECGGAVTVESEPGWGSVFTVYLPSTAADVQSSMRKSGEIPRGSEHILFVDDEELLVEMGTYMLEDLGYKVTATTSSIEALDLFRLHPDQFDLVITDTTMPNMTGVDLSKELLRIRPDISIILCTGFSELVDEENASALGVKEFIMKPFSIRSIAQIIRDVLDQ